MFWNEEWAGKTVFEAIVSIPERDLDVLEHPQGTPTRAFFPVSIPERDLDVLELGDFNHGENCYRSRFNP